MKMFDKAIHDLISTSLREPSFSDMSILELRKYNYLLGIALHNIPDYLNTDGKLPLSDI
jgi:hypothetical protein